MQPSNKSGVLSSSLGTASAAMCCEDKKVNMTVTCASNYEYSDFRLLIDHSFYFSEETNNRFIIMYIVLVVRRSWLVQP